jgi:hypothetical protein
MAENELINKKEQFLTANGFRYTFDGDIWLSSFGCISREYLEDHSFKKIKEQISEANIAYKQARRITYFTNNPIKKEDLIEINDIMKVIRKREKRLKK